MSSDRNTNVKDWQAQSTEARTFILKAPDWSASREAPQVKHNQRSAEADSDIRTLCIKRFIQMIVKK